MSINFNCACGKPLTAPPEFAGKNVRCPGCSNTTTVPTFSAEEPIVATAYTTPGSGSGQPIVNATGGNRRCHELDYEIVGDDMQMVIVELDPGETVIAEAGAMNFMEEGISFESKMGDGSEPEQGFFGKMLSAGKRAITGESIFMTHFTHHGSGKSHVAFAAPYPGKIIPIDLASIEGNDLLCQKDAFLCAAMGTKVTIAFNRKFGAGLFGGEGFILQRLVGDGLACIHAGGTVVGESEEYGLRRRRTLFGNAARHRTRLVAKSTTESPSKSSGRSRGQWQRRRLGAWRAGEPTRRRRFLIVYCFATLCDTK